MNGTVQVILQASALASTSRVSASISSGNCRISPAVRSAAHASASAWLGIAATCAKPASAASQASRRAVVMSARRQAAAPASTAGCGWASSSPGGGGGSFGRQADNLFEARSVGVPSAAGATSASSSQAPSGDAMWCSSPTQWWKRCA